MVSETEMDDPDVFFIPDTAVHNVSAKPKKNHCYTVMHINSYTEKKLCPDPKCIN